MLYITHFPQYGTYVTLLLTASYIHVCIAREKMESVFQPLVQVLGLVVT